MTASQDTPLDVMMEGMFLNDLASAIEGLEALVINAQILRPEPDLETCDAMDRWGVPPAKELVEGYSGNDTDTVCDNVRLRRLQYLMKLANYIMFGGSRMMPEKRISIFFAASVGEITTPLWNAGPYPYFTDFDPGSGFIKIKARVSRDEFLESREDYLAAQALFDEWSETIKKPKELPEEPEGPEGPIGPGGLPPGYADTAYTAPMFDPRKVLLRSIKKTGGLTVVGPAYAPWNSKYDYLWNMWR